ncbi:hypothetical protein JC796_24545 [Delftia acidovorans]|nr:hypothetical protein [Delftia acidovorans]MBJ2143930.1 hypothetical protein [Delftia acidovorans]
MDEMDEMGVRDGALSGPTGAAGPTGTRSNITDGFAFGLLASLGYVE